MKQIKNVLLVSSIRNTIFLFAFCLSTVVQAKVQFFLIELDQGKVVKKPMSFSVIEEKEEFEVVAKDGNKEVRALTYKAKVAIPPEFSMASVQSQQGSATFKDGTLFLAAQDIEQEILVNRQNGAATKMLVVKTFENPTIVQDGCTKNFPDVVLSTDSEKTTFPIGVHCVLRPSGNKAITLSFPRSVDIDSTTFFDILGKGERWRFFEIPDTEQQGGIIGNVTFGFKGKNYKINLVSINLEQLAALKMLEELQKENRSLKDALADLKKKNKDMSESSRELQKKADELEMLISYFEVYFGIGNSSMTFALDQSTVGTSTLTDSELSLQMFTMSAPIWGRLIFESGFSTTLPMSQKTNRLDSFLGYGNLGYSIDLKKLTLIPVVGGAYRNYTHQLSGFALQTGHFGGGLIAKYNLSANDELGLKFESQPAGTKVVKSHMGLNLHYTRRFQMKKSWKLGAKYESVHVDAVNAIGAPQKFDESRMMLYISL